MFRPIRQPSSPRPLSPSHPPYFYFYYFVRSTLGTESTVPEHILLLPRSSALSHPAAVEGTVGTQVPYTASVCTLLELALPSAVVMAWPPLSASLFGPVWRVMPEPS